MGGFIHTADAFLLKKNCLKSVFNYGQCVSPVLVVGPVGKRLGFQMPPIVSMAVHTRLPIRAHERGHGPAPLRPLEASEGET